MFYCYVGSALGGCHKYPQLQPEVNCRLALILGTFISLIIKLNNYNLCLKRCLFVQRFEMAIELIYPVMGLWYYSC